MKLKNSIAGNLFILTGILSLLAGLFFGVLGGLQYVLPDFLKESLSFQQMRPLHVYLVINWIFCAAVGGLYFYLPVVTERKLFSTVLAFIHAGLQILILIIVVTGYFQNVFGGREYFEFPPWVVSLIILAWLNLMVNFFATVKFNFKNSPVYFWSWATGLVFFLITVLEAQLWVLPFFNNNIIRDVTVQWKALGSMVGSWNMLIYGCSIFVMEKITGNTSIAKSKKSFFFYFLGLTNLMFNWGHHTYIVPSSEAVKTVSYVISMTELLILGNIIYSFKQSYLRPEAVSSRLCFRILTYAEIWVFANLVLALIISIPAINFYTHGTHITVAHAMGATIGINTMLLLASLVFIIQHNEIPQKNSFKGLHIGVVITNISLLIFWVSMIGMGLAKISAAQQQKGFYEMMEKLMPYFRVFAASGIFILIGLVMVLVPLLVVFTKFLFADSEKSLAD